MGERAARHLKAELKRADLTYEELAEAEGAWFCGSQGQHRKQKLARATIPAAFFLAAMACIGVAEVALEVSSRTE
jgi:hypothetical protein